MHEKRPPLPVILVNLSVTHLHLTRPAGRPRASRARAPQPLARAAGARLGHGRRLRALLRTPTPSEGEQVTNKARKSRRVRPSPGHVRGVWTRIRQDPALTLASLHALLCWPPIRRKDGPRRPLMPRSIRIHFTLVREEIRSPCPGPFPPSGASRACAPALAAYPPRAPCWPRPAAARDSAHALRPEGHPPAPWRGSSWR
jgi:hypothetical protein